VTISQKNKWPYAPRRGTDCVRDILKSLKIKTGLKMIRNNQAKIIRIFEMIEKPFFEPVVGFYIGTFRQLRLIFSSRRLGVMLGGFL
jgi:hypothetical protein